MTSDIQQQAPPAFLPESAAVRGGRRERDDQGAVGDPGQHPGGQLRPRQHDEHPRVPQDRPLPADARPGDAVPRHAGRSPAERLSLHPHVQRCVSKKDTLAVHL